MPDKKPQKKYLSEKPLIDTAALTAEGPGTGYTSIFFLTHSETKILPGSETAGVPASEINDIIFFFF